MKLVRFGSKGAEKPGLIDRQGRIRDLSDVVHDIDGSALSPDGIVRLRSLDEAALPLAPSGARLGACVGSVGKLIGIGLNYSDHAAEVGKSAPSEPSFFLKATSSIVGPNDPIQLPRGSVKTDWEVELGVVIGLPGKYVSAKDALDLVAGYCTAADISERQYQGEGGPTHGKSFDTFGPLGPWLVTKDEVVDPHALKLTCDVDDERRQNGTTAALIFNVPAIIAHLSRYFTLQPGDVIITGTPAGVGSGRKPPVFLQAGQKLKMAVEHLGEQQHRIVAG